MYDNMKEVYFDQYCPTCKHASSNDKDGYNEICDECLGEGARQYSHKPVRYEAREKK